MKIDNSLFRKLISGTCTPEELESLHNYFAQADRSSLDAELKKEWEKFSDQSISENMAKAEIWNRLKQNQSLLTSSVPIQKRRRVIRWVAAAAAVVILVVSGHYIFGPKSIPVNLVEKINDSQLPMSISLDDGSIVWLKPQSMLSYNQGFTETARIVYLKGEARFDVVTDSLKPFIVETDNLETRVLGTMFKVKADISQETTEILLFEGSVVVSPKEGEAELRSLILRPGEKAQFQKSTQKLSKNRLVENSKSSWNDGIIIFQRADVDEIVATLENWYDINISIPNRERITGNLMHRINTKKMSLDEIISSINLVSKYQIIKIKDHEYEVKPKE